MVSLSIGMATYKDFDGVYFSVQALRLYQDLTDTEILVVDNYGCPDTRAFVEAIGARYIEDLEVQGTSAPRNTVFREARGEAVLCIDSHVMLEAGTVERLRAWYRDHPGTMDLLQGPLLHDSLRHVSTHFDPVWNGQMWGTWGTDPRGLDPENEPFDIPMQGVGLFSCRREAWPGFNPAFRGFGAEEGYLHEKFRRNGGRTLCVPWLRWVHRFGRPNGVPYPLTVEEKLRNYLIGHHELGFDLVPIVEHFREHLSDRNIEAVILDVFGPDRPLLEQLGLAPYVAAPAPAVHRSDDVLLVSCLCPTFGRFPDAGFLLEEAVASFLQQDYPNRELVILNDGAGQELACTAPHVRVVNVPDRFASLGAKRNALVHLAHGDLLAPWDDSAISLPWRLSLLVEALGSGDYINFRRYFVLDDDRLTSDHSFGAGIGFSLYTRAAWERAGGHPYTTASEERIFHEQMVSANERVIIPGREGGGLAIDDWFGIVRREIPAVDQEIVPGRSTIRPHWERDYVALAAAAAARHPAAGAAVS